MKFEEVKGRKKDSIVLYALSTCIWCQKTKQLLNDLGVAYSYVFVDLLPDEEKEEAVSAITAWNPASSFPMIVVNNRESIIGYKPDELKKRFG